VTGPRDRDLRRLQHVADACERILAYTADGRDSLDDSRTYDAVLHCLTVIGEALGALSDEAYALLPSVPPGLPRAQRNRIVHEYWRVDPEVVWSTIEVALPALSADAARVLGR
jgi:uncharacterized protein with HEPN domain